MTDPSDQVVITTNYQWLPENYIINRLFPVPFSNTYDDYLLVLGIASVFCVIKFAFLFLLCHSCADAYFPLFSRNHAYMFVVCILQQMNEWIGKPAGSSGS